MENLAFPWLIVLPLASSPVVYLAGRVGVHESILRRRSWIVRILALVAALGMWYPFALAVRNYFAEGVHRFHLASIWLKVDGISLLMAASVLTLGTLVILFSGRYMAGEASEEKYYAMLLAMMGLMIGLSCADDLFNLWVWFEAMAVSSYLLVAFYREQAASLEAGMKYLVQSAIGSALVLVGIALVLANSGTFDLSKLAGAESTPALLAAGALFVIGFGVKAALVPMHTWLPDAHSQAPSGISAMLSGVVIEAGLIAMLRALSITGMSIDWGALLMVFGGVNIVFGNLLALRQTQVKRMLAFSSLSHMGYMLTGLGIALSTGILMGAQGAFFHLFNHMLMKGLAFLAVGALMYALFIANDQHRALSVSDLAGAAKKYPLAAFALSVALLALGGLPPLAGFMSKWMIFLAGFESQNEWIIALMIFMALNSVLSLGYYAPLVNAMYRETPSSAVEKGKAIPFSIALPLIFLAGLVIVLGFAPWLMDWLTVPAGQALMQIFGK